jgi:hypothetical protein
MRRVPDRGYERDRPFSPWMEVQGRKGAASAARDHGQRGGHPGSSPAVTGMRESCLWLPKLPQIFPSRSHLGLDEQIFGAIQQVFGWGQATKKRRPASYKVREEYTMSSDVKFLIVVGTLTLLTLVTIIIAVELAYSII